MRTALALLFLAACGTGDITGGDDVSGTDGGGDDDPDAAPVVGEPAGLEGTTAAHNTVRAGVGVAALTWDPALALIAQGWADQCLDTMAPTGLIDHNPNRSDTYPEYVGENVYGSSGGASGTDATQLWAAESQYYNYPANTCDGGQICGHYTQIVWRSTTKIGCGLSNCPGLLYSNSVVCNYAPGGNSGGLPY